MVWLEFLVIKRPGPSQETKFHLQAERLVASPSPIGASKVFGKLEVQGYRRSNQNLRAMMQLAKNLMPS